MNNDLIKQLTAEKSRLLILVDAIDKLLSVYKTDESVTPAIITPSDTHSDAFSINSISEAKNIPEKVLFALKELKIATASQVAKKLNELDPSFPLDKARRDCTVHLSKYYRAKRIEAKTSGYSYIYQYTSQKTDDYNPWG